MSKLQSLLIQAKSGLTPWESIPKERLADIIQCCGQEEIEEIKARIVSLNAELQTVEEWDGDTQDDIKKTIYFFKQLLELSAQQS